MVRIEGLTKLVQQLGDRFDKARREKDLAVVVGYTQNYALVVHEVQAKHMVGQWKYLETPARARAEQIGKRVAQVTKATGSLEMGLIQGGLLLQRISQDEFVPVDLGPLKASAYTATERDAPAAAAKAFAKSEAIRKSGRKKR